MEKKKIIYVGLILLGISALLYILSSKSQSLYLPDSLEESKSKLHQEEYDSAIYYARKILGGSKDPNNTAYALSIIAYSFYAKNDLDSALNYYAQSLKIEPNESKVLRASNFNMLGLIFQTKQSHSSAINYFKEAITLYEQEKSQRLPIAYYNLAYSQSQTDNIDCIKSYYKALEYASKFEDYKYESYCLNDLGNLMIETNNYEAAKEYFIESMDNEFAKNSPASKAFALQGLGTSEYHLKEYSNAKVHALEVLKLKRENNIVEHLFTTYYLLGRIYRDTGDLIEAENNLKRALIYYPNNESNKKSVNVFKELSDVQFKLGKTNQAEYHNQLHYEELERMLDERKEAYQLSKVAI